MRVLSAMLGALALAAAGNGFPGPSPGTAAAPGAAPTPSPAAAAGAERLQFCYVLRLVPRLRDGDAWTEADRAAVGRHFARLKGWHAEGKVLLAGRTLNEGEASMFGIVILEAQGADEARAMMEADDAVKEGVMTAELFPFRVALGR